MAGRRSYRSAKHTDLAKETKRRRKSQKTTRTEQQPKYAALPPHKTELQS